MIPLRDNIPSSRPPLVTLVIVAINALVFFLELTAPEGAERMIFAHGLIPQREMHVFLGNPLAVGEWLRPFFTSMFLHGGFMHVIGNLWFLWIFGDNVEDRLGHARFAMFYVGCGLVAAVTQLLTAPGSTVPIIGASGAIAGVLGAYMVLFPTARVITFIPIFFLPWLIQVPAVFFLGVWFLEQLWAGGITLTSARGDVGGVAWWAHAGGFLTGSLFAWRFRGRRRRATQVEVLDDFPWR